jgi:hypothetical protein
MVPRTFTFPGLLDEVDDSRCHQAGCVVEKLRLKKSQL